MEQIFEIELTLPIGDDGTELKIVASGRASWSVDPAYGEDADGNRGQKQVLLDDFEVTEIKELVTGLPRYDLIADDWVAESIKERLLEDGPERE